MAGAGGGGARLERWQATRELTEEADGAFERLRKARGPEALAGYASRPDVQLLRQQISKLSRIDKLVRRRLLMLKEISVKKTDLTIKDVVTTVLVGMGACAATMLVKKFLSHSRSAYHHLGRLFVVKSDNSGKRRAITYPLSSRRDRVQSECSGGNGAVRYDGTTVDLTPGSMRSSI